MAKTTGVKLDKAGWATLRGLAEQGKTDEWLEAEFGVPANTIRQHRWADRKRGKPWLTPKFKQEQEEAERLKKSMKNLKNDGLKKQTEEPENQTETALQIVSPGEIAQLKEQVPGIIAKGVSELLLAALPTMPPPKDWSEFKTLHSIFRDSAGLNQSSGGIAIQFNGMDWSSSKKMEKPIVLDV